jgi:hypothetical protein
VLTLCANILPQTREALCSRLGGPQIPEVWLPSLGGRSFGRFGDSQDANASQILLGQHRSVRITEKHYNPWVRSRQEQLEADIENALAKDPVALIELKGTQRVRGEREVFN